MESFLDEQFLRRLEKLKVLAQKGVRGAERGEQISWRSGSSLEFLDYRKYQLGDDLRYVDWNVYGRLDKLFIKLFRAEENQTIHILMDTSRSMRLGNPSKELYAKKIAAALSYISLANLDRVRVSSFGTRINQSMAPARSRISYSKVLHFLLALESSGATHFNASLAEYATLSKQQGIAIVLSDVMDPRGFKEGLEALSYGRFHVALLQIMDGTELEPQAVGNLLFKEIETGTSRRMTVDANLLARYRETAREYVNEIREFCLAKGIDYFLCDTRIAFEDFLLDYLAKGRLFRA
ncbi:MAG: DUF58 domain-containing protein [Desulfobacteraceae bacterium]|nr:MAG: DUF58 domain-containing protein [Desulfobacteraceae bacterium]